MAGARLAGSKGRAGNKKPRFCGAVVTVSLGQA
jgi:hypothetical protein